MKKAQAHTAPPAPRRVVIPTSFSLYGKQFNVGASESLFNGRCDSIGRIDIPSQCITIQKDTPQIDSTRQSKEQTFYHELVHGMLDMMGRRDLSREEGFVEHLSSLLHQFEVTKAGDLAI